MPADGASELDTAIKWYRTHSESVSKYFGEWVAIGSQGVVAHGSDLKNVSDMSKKKGVARPLLYKVPPKGILALWWACA
jgi:hypothetical protein